MHDLAMWTYTRLRPSLKQQQQQQQQQHYKLSIPSVPTFPCASPVFCEMDPGGQPTSAAQRRRGRRLRAALRHERQSIAMALAEFTHQSSIGQMMARSGRVEREMKYTAKFRLHPPPRARHAALHSRRRQRAGARGLAA